MEKNQTKSKLTSIEKKKEKQSKAMNSKTVKKEEKNKVKAEKREKKIVMKMKEEKQQDSKYRLKRKLVIIVLLIAAMIIYIIQRGEYLEIKEIGENYIPIFWKNFKSIAITAILNFGLIYSCVFFMTKRIKNTLKTFFEDEKKPMPGLPQKSISFILATIVTIATSTLLMDKALLCFYNTQFVITDPVLGLDIGFYIFILPFVKLLVTYALILSIGITVYAALYYLLVFNICFDGIQRETIKKTTLLGQALFGLKVIVVFLALLVLVETQNIGTQKFMTLNRNETLNYSLYGAGSTEIYISYAAYIILVFLMIFSVYRAIRFFQKKETRKVIKNILIVPGYLLLVVIVMIGYSLFFVNSNELDKERKYINDNIQYTKMGYNIDIEDIALTDAGAITEQAINEYGELVNNIPTVNSELVLKDLNTSLTNNDYYKYMYTNQALYSINGKNQLVYLTPREIETNYSEYSNKTYEYTHGYGVIVTSANAVTASGNLNHIQKSFEETNEAISISEPRIYFGRETNSIVVTNSIRKNEFDYPLNSVENAENDYQGSAGLCLNIFERIVLAIKERDPQLAFSGGIKSDSKILTNRNILKRVKTIMPYLLYDDNPYIVVRNNGELIWVIDAYTISNEYPYSQRTILADYGIAKEEINYIRNSVKVIVNAYSGEVTFYRTDKNDPIAAAYKKLYPSLFTEEEIPEDIISHLVYPSYLFEIQSNLIQRYHHIEADDLYRSDNVWNVATQNTTQMSNKKGSNIAPYYTMLKTNDSNASRMGLVLPYTLYNKENIIAYLVGSIDENGNQVLKTYTYAKENNVIGPMQLDAQISKDETIAKELESLNVAGTKIIKTMIVVPVNNYVLYVEPIYQQYVNDPESLPILKKVIVASGSKVTVGNTYEEAVKNLISQNTVEIEIDNTENLNDLMDAIIRANQNLKTSTQSGDWTQMGKDTQRLQELISRLQEVKEKEDDRNQKELLNEQEQNITVEETTLQNNT